jgi:DNA processing protein
MRVCYTDFQSVDPTDQLMSATHERIRMETGRVPRQISLGDTAYPANLREIQTPPGRLYVRGALAEDDALAVAIVGARAATPYGVAVAERLAADLAARGVTVVSGLARGIDSAAHRGALRAGGRTIAVLGSGVDVIYPPENRRLAKDIETSGALVSQFAPGTRPLAGYFPARNRVIAGLSLGVVVVEAAEKSGSLITAGLAAARSWPCPGF